MPETRSSAKKAALTGEKHETDAKPPVSPPVSKRVKEDTSKAKDKGKRSATSKASAGGRQTRTGRRSASTESEKMPASIVEKGIIYFFVRGRVNVDDPSGVDDVARSYFILKPIQLDAQLKKAPLDDVDNARLFVLPKKVFPGRGGKVMAFVDKTHTSLPELRDEFLQGTEYETKTVGIRHTPAATPVGEGAYAITNTGKESHLCYLLSLPSQLDEVQKELGLAERGSFIISTKNPEFPGPGYSRLPKKPNYPEEITQEFESYRWIPTKPAHLEYQNTQVLLVGERKGLGKATETREDNHKMGKLDPEEAIDQMEEDDIERMNHLGDDASEAIYTDLKADAENYPGLKTTF